MWNHSFGCEKIFEENQAPIKAKSLSWKVRFEEQIVVWQWKIIRRWKNIRNVEQKACLIIKSLDALEPAWSALVCLLLAADHSAAFKKFKKSLNSCVTPTVNSENAFLSDETFLSRIAFSSQGRVFRFNLTWFCIDRLLVRQSARDLTRVSRGDWNCESGEVIIEKDDKLLSKHIDLNDDQSLL